MLISKNIRRLSFIVLLTCGTNVLTALSVYAQDVNPATQPAESSIQSITQVIKSESNEAVFGQMMYCVEAETLGWEQKTVAMTGGQLDPKVVAPIKQHSADSAARRFAAWMEDRKSGDDGKIQVPETEYNAIAKASPAVLAFVNQMSGFGFTGENYGFLNSPRVARIGQKGNDRVLLITSVCTSTVLNTERTTGPWRGGYVVKDVSFQRASDLAKCGQQSGVAYIGMMINYGAKDLGDESATAMGESVTIIAPVTVWQHFGDMELDEAAFLAQSDSYICDNGGVRKVKLEMK